MPALYPALLISWQGNPPQMTSTPHSLTVTSRHTSGVNGPIGNWCQLYANSTDRGGKVLTSSCRLTLGQCFASTFWQYGSISTCHLHVMPARSNPRSKPPIPANKLPNVIASSFQGGTVAGEGRGLAKRPAGSRSGVQSSVGYVADRRPLCLWLFPSGPGCLVSRG